MIFGRKVPKIKKSEFYPLELKLIELIMEELNPDDSFKISNQLNYLPLKRRIKYPERYVVEFYPEKFDGIPTEYLLERKEEFRLAALKINCNDREFYCQVYACLGNLFDISFKPVPSNSELKNNSIVLGEIKLESELKNNIY